MLHCPTQRARAWPQALAIVAMLAALPAARAAVPDAEFAVRWDPRQGGPATPQDVLQALKLQADAPRRFEVRYFDFQPPADVPPGFDAILRQRVSGGVTELTFKLRGHAPLPPQPTLEDWSCPLGATNERKDEVDVGFASAGRVLKAWSRSCSVETHDAALQPPPALRARLKGCGSTMTRLTAGHLKIEQWQQADGTTLIEASRPGHDTKASTRSFEREVLAPLLALQVQPLERSKSAIGGDCAR